MEVNILGESRGLLNESFMRFLEELTYSATFSKRQAVITLITFPVLMELKF